MKLIGMLDSPYVRRVAISLHCLGLPFEHEPLSVFSTFREFQAINPQVKAPTLVLDDGTLLMDSTLILAYAETCCGTSRSLMPGDPAALTRTLHILGISLAVCEKAVQLVYERNLRPGEKQHAPWIARLSDQLHAGCRKLDALYSALYSAADRTRDRDSPDSSTLDQARLTTAVVWRSMQDLVPDQWSGTDYPALTSLSAEAESLSEFRAWPPDGPGVAAVD